MNKRKCTEISNLRMVSSPGYLLMVVLYSRKDSVWKLADFGFTSEGTSRSFVYSASGRGTPGYRAPELLSDTSSTFTNKVDIWSMGCILYELAVGRKAFISDWTVFTYTSSGEVDVPLDDHAFSEKCKANIDRNIRCMLQITPLSRPSAAELFEEFCCNCEDPQRHPSEKQIGLVAKLQDNSEERQRINKLIKTLKDAHTDVSARDEHGSTRMHEAAANGRVDEIKALKELGADVSAQDNFLQTPMHRAAYYGHVDAIRALKELGADVSAQNKYGSTPLHRAAWGGHVDAIRVLKELGADVSAQDKFGDTPMHWAASGRHVDAIRVLKELGADVSAQDNAQRTPMHWAASCGHVDAIRVLKELGADVSAQDKFRQNPMHWAASRGHVDAIRVLKELGADVSVQDADGMTPMKLAKRYQHTNAVKVLEELGAE